ncbi:uncharacterized protein LOC131946239 [Physella acuta]|uniref:uncharacterized protein LOC131946239 n=1 Tax=Physella acuta TaxID=109671 RepID=UPI0027DC47EE|nr:uncharacterized protein LOC131946239 [Physella acuta]
MFYVETNLTENPSFDQPGRVDSPEEVDVYPTKSDQDRGKDVHPYDTHVSSTSYSPQYSDTKNIQHSAEPQNTSRSPESQNITRTPESQNTTRSPESLNTCPESQNTLHGTESQNTPHNIKTQNTHSSDEHHTTCHEPAQGNSPHQGQGNLSQSVYHFNSTNQDGRADSNSSPIGNSSMPGISQAESISTQGQSRLFGFDVRSNHQVAKTAHLAQENSSQFKYKDGHHDKTPDRHTEQYSNSHNHGAINLSLENSDKNSEKVLPYPSTGMNYPAWYGNPSGPQNFRGGPVAPGGQPQPLTDKTNTPEPQNDATQWKHLVPPYMLHPMFNGRNFDFNTNYNLSGNQLQNSYSHYLDYYYNKGK